MHFSPSLTNFHLSGCRGLIFPSLRKATKNRKNCHCETPKGSWQSPGTNYPLFLRLDRNNHLIYPIFTTFPKNRPGSGRFPRLLPQPRNDNPSGCALQAASQWQRFLSLFLSLRPCGAPPSSEGGSRCAAARDGKPVPYSPTNGNLNILPS